MYSMLNNRVRFVPLFTLEKYVKWQVKPSFPVCDLCQPLWLFQKQVLVAVGRRLSSLSKSYSISVFLWYDMHWNKSHGCFSF